MTSGSFTLVLAAGSAAALLVVLATYLLSREASHIELVKRVRRVVHTGAVSNIEPTRSLGGSLVTSLGRLGEVIRAAAVFSPGNVADLERTAAMAGLDPRRMVPALIGAKVLLIGGGPLLVFFGMMLAGWSSVARLAGSAVAVIIGMVGPSIALGFVRRAHAQALRRGLPDALDLLVVCTGAGLGLETAIDRVAVEIRPSHPAIAIEFAILAQEMRMSSDRSAVLARMGERTGLDSFQRLAGTLSQTLRFGTPLGQALRAFASDMRNERMLRLEERAARLPALLTIPLILFILPCLFIVLAGPAAIRVLNIMEQ